MQHSYKGTFDGGGAVAGGMGTGSSGAVAERISNASFATLMLIYSFTELLDLADVLSDFAGLTARIAQLLEVSCPLLSIHQQ